jgi:hypothetical protein
MVGGIEGEGPRGEPTAHQPSQQEQTQPLQGRAEGRESLQWPTTIDQSERLLFSTTLPLTPHEEPA